MLNNCSLDTLVGSGLQIHMQITLRLRNASAKLQHLSGFLALKWMLGLWPPALTHISPSAFDPCRPIASRSVYDLSRGFITPANITQVITSFSRTPMAWHFNWAIITIRIQVLYESIIRRNTSSLLSPLFRPVRIECSVWLYFEVLIKCWGVKVAMRKAYGIYWR